MRTVPPCWDCAVSSERAGVLMMEKDDTLARSSAILADTFMEEDAFRP
ncbi:hypothetical protein [Parasaccharibacter apium]|nr:hypothetical protein [Parasaccharibacter apium]